jgi:signal transduction histidine kinase/ligand-binding sensor domain-containing protein/DNA-binding response OmpR family regulator
VGGHKHTYWFSARAFGPAAAVLAFVLVNLHCLFAQERLLPVFQFNRITTADGLPANEITSNVVRDRQGFIWVGTADGLARYDGYTCRVYPEFSVGRNALILHVDRNGRLWVGTFNTGISLYDAVGDRFINFPPRPNDSSWYQSADIGSAFEDESGTLWFGGDPQIVRVDLSGTRGDWSADSVARHIRFRTVSHKSFKYVAEVNAWDDSNIVAGTSEGLYLVNRRTYSITRPPIPSLEGLSLDTVAIMCLRHESPHKLWIGTLLHGLYLFDQSNGRLTAFHKGMPNRGRPQEKRINDIQLDKSGRMWIGTGIGLDLLDPATGRYQDYAPLGGAPGPSRWTRMSVDNTGILWIGTSDDGLCFLFPQSLRFLHYALQKSPGALMEMETIDRWNDGSYWIGAEGKVLRVQMDDLTVRETVDLFKGKKSQYQRTGFWASFNDGKGSLWYGAWGPGLYRFEPKTGKATNFLSSSQLGNLLFAQDVCCSIVDADSGSLWIAAYEDGVLRFDTRRALFSRPLIDPQGEVVHLTKDREGKVWISDLLRGLLVYEPATSAVDSFPHNSADSNSLSDPVTRSTYLDPQGRVWIGCRQVDLWRPGTKSFDHFPNPGFADATEATPLGADIRGRLWVAYRGKGVGVLDPDTRHFTNFDISDGLIVPLNMALLEDGRVLLVGAGGMNIIDADSLGPNRRAPPLTFTRVSINDSIRLPLPQVESGSALQLPYSQNVLEFTFAAIDPGVEHLIEYFYRLEGLEDSWIHPGDRRYVRYPGLSPGRYVFRVKATQRFGQWPDQEIFLAITITPPWWRTWLAYSIYAILLIGLLFTGYRLRLRQVHLKQQAEMEHFQAEHLAEVDRLKSRFFSNVSHEFRTPLTLILGPADQVLDAAEESSMRQKLLLIKENAKKLFGLVNQLLDFSRLEAGVMRLQVSKGDIVRFLRRVVMSFESWAERKHITLEFTSEAHTLEAYFDRDKLEKIVNNLMSNALKFTPDGGSVSVSVGEAQFRNLNSLRLSVSDTGPGIAAEHLPHIFDRFYRVDETHAIEGTGIGLALTKELIDLHHGTISAESTPGKGSVFTVALPIARTAYRTEEISESPRETEPQEPIASGTAQAQPEHLPAATSTEGKPIVLIVEDNPDLSRYIREYLETYFAVREARNGKEGCELAFEIIPDIVVSDVMMPEMDGMKLCRALKQDVRTSHVPVILLTARADLESKIGGLEIGADDYVTKPFDSKELMARVRNLIDQRRQLRKKFSAGVVLKPGEVTVTSLDDALLKKIMNVVEKNIGNENFSVDDLARDASLSRRHLYRKLEALTNLAPSEFIQYIRLQRAHELLEKNAGSVAEIGYQVGFGSPSYFSACFHERFGVPPSEILNRDSVHHTKSRDRD